ncbi:DUF6162 family protein [Endozoicomonadaceae bacterium StTr2]
MLLNSDGYTEQVRPDDGRRESGWVLLAIVLILLSGGIGIASHQAAPTSRPDYLSLSVQDKAVLTDLRNAGDEILFLQEDGQPLPDVLQLADDGIPPFQQQSNQQRSHHWQKQSGPCYAGTPVNGTGLNFLLLLEGSVRVYWQPAATHESDSLHSDEAATCSPDEHWQLFQHA